MNISNKFRKIRKNIKEFLEATKEAPKWGYIFFFAFGLFLFLFSILIFIIISTLEWGMGQAADFAETVECMENSIIMVLGLSILFLFIFSIYSFSLTFYYP